MSNSPAVLVGAYDPVLVTLSILIAVSASYTALDLTSRITMAQGRLRLAWLAGGAGAMGSGIWSMHYIGMLAFTLPVRALYDVPTVLLSLLAAIFASAVAFVIVSRPSMGLSRVLFGGSVMGLGITAMHYTGMAAMRLHATTQYDPLLVATSVAIAIGVSFVGLLLLFRFRENPAAWNWPKFISAVVMGLAIPSMHYTAMAAASFVRADAILETTYALDVSVLGTVAVTLGTVMVLGLALVVPREHVPYAWLPALVVMTTVLALAIGASALYYVENHLIAATGESLKLAAVEIADKLTRTLAERRKDVQMIARTRSAKLLNASALTEHLTLIKKNSPDAYLWLGVTDHHGRVIAATDPAAVGLDMSAQSWFQAVSRGAVIHLRDVQPDALTGGTETVAFTAPIAGPEGQFAGTVTARISSAALVDTVTQTLRTLRTMHGALGRVEYQFMTHDGDVFVDAGVPRTSKVNLKRLGLPSALLSEANRFGYVEEEHARRHVPIVTGYARSLSDRDVPGLQWTILVRMDRSDILASTRVVLLKVGAAEVVLLAPLLGFLLWTTGRVRGEYLQARQEGERARAAEQRTRLIVDTSLDAVITMDAGGIITDWNIAAEPMFGRSREEAVGRRLSDVIIPPTRREACERELRPIFATGEGPILNKRTEMTAMRRDGTEFPVELCIASIPSGSTYFLGAFLRDLTGQKEHERSKLALLAAERTNQAKSEFLSRMSHELRTPLNAILGFAQLLEMDNLTADQRNSINLILKGGRHLLNLINEVLDISRVDAGTLRFSLEPVPLQQTVRDAMDLIKQSAAERRITVQVEGLPENGLHVRADCQRLRQILLNLLSNAVKYNRDGGSVTVRCVRESGGLVRLTVSDTGPGISPEELTRLFVPFDRLGAEQRGIEGTGLGLSLAKRLVEGMGGRLIADSTVGQGSTFSVELTGASPSPSEPAPSPSTAPADPGSSPARTILYIEDNLSNLELIQRLLEPRGGITLLSTMQGRLGLDLARQHKPDLILLDLHLPDVKGETVLLQMKADPTLREIPVVILSADATPRQIERLREKGARAYLTKPLDLKQFLALVNDTLP